MNGRTQPRSFLRACPLLLALAALAGCQTLDNAFGINRSRTPANRPAQGPPPAVSLAPSEARSNDAVARADLLRRQGLTDQALSEFERIIETNPRLTIAYMGAGDIYREKGDYAHAEQRYAKAAELEPRNFNAQYLHGLTLQLLDRVVDAVQAYLRALSVKPDDFNANLNLAIAYFQLGEPSQALPYAERAVRIDGRSAPARINLGSIYAALNRHEDAVTEYQQAAELTELSTPLLLNLADSLGKAGRYAEMVNTLQQLIRTEPSALAYERLGSAYFRMTQYADSLAAFRKALEIDPNHYPALNGVAVCLLNQWHWSGKSDEPARAEAISALRRSLQIEKNQPRIIELLSTYQ